MAKTYNYDYDIHTVADIATLGAKAFGNRPALTMIGQKAITYNELEKHTKNIAIMLIKLGIKQGDRVAIISENCPEWGVASLSIARAGAISVPLLTDFSASQMLQILKHCGASAAIVSEKYMHKMAEADLTILTLNTICETAALSEHDGIELPTVKPNDLSAIVYTSGTTGTPKGVMLTHRNYMSDMVSSVETILVNEKDVFLSILPLAHTYEYTLGFLLAMVAGASVHYMDKPPTATALKPALKAVRPTIMLSVPLVIEKTYKQGVLPTLQKMKLYKVPVFKYILQRIAGIKLYKAFGGRLRFFGVGGAPLDPATEKFLYTTKWPYAIGYGLTETAPLIAGSSPHKTRLRAVGPAMIGVEMRLGDMQVSEIDPTLMVGEIQVKGPMVSPGYYLDPELSAACKTSDGYFKTGDLAYADKKGYICIRGRSKNMILSASGENIYPEEVEAVLAQSPQVGESLVFGGVEGLTALIHLKPEAIEAAMANVKASVDQAEKIISEMLENIRKEANKHLANFSRIARAMYQPDSFEKTPTQKIKRFLYIKAFGKKTSNIN